MDALRKLKNHVMESSRKRKIEHFYSHCSGEVSILDVGVSMDRGQGGPNLNYFLKTFRYGDDAYTGLGIQDLSGMSVKYPGKKFVQYPGGRFPFSDNQFTHCFSNAVIEHVGSPSQQVDFVNEMIRVAGLVFFTTPNKFFPVESHTDALFVHWHESSFRKWCKKHRPYWTSENLNLLSFAELDRVMKKTTVDSYEIFRNRIMGMPMTYSVVCRRPSTGK